MEFIKKHYEKVILSVVLIGLIGVLVGMWFVIVADKQKMLDTVAVITPKAQPLAPLDMSRQDAVMLRLKQPPALDFSQSNKLFNPVQWQRDLSGKLIKLSTGHEVGAGAAIVTKITPLYFSIRLDSVETNLSVPRYKIYVEHQGSPYPAYRRPIPHYAGLNDKVNGVFTVKGVEGTPQNPTALILQLPSGETVKVGRDKPFERVESYSADIQYPPEHINATGLRVGDVLNFASDQYNIIDINQNEVRLLAQSNQKKYTLPYRQ